MNYILTIIIGIGLFTLNCNAMKPVSADETEEYNQSIFKSAMIVGVPGVNWMISGRYKSGGVVSSFKMDTPESINVVQSVPIQYRKDLQDSKSMYDLKIRAKEANNMYEAQRHLKDKNIPKYSAMIIIALIFFIIITFEIIINKKRKTLANKK